MKSIYFISLNLILLFISAKGQQEQGLQELENNLEEMASDGLEAQIPYEILEDLSAMIERPIILNKATAKELETLTLLNDYQISHFLEYREEYGELLSFNEILAVPGFNTAILEQIQPFVSLNGEKDMKLPVLAKTRKTKAYLIGRYSRNYLLSSGNGKSQKEEPDYLGSPDKYYLKTTVEYRNHLSAGFLAEKDAGEPFFAGEIPDTLKEFRKPGFDFYTGFIAFQNWKFIKKIVVGDFHVQAGQGLTLWTSNHWSAPSMPSQIIKRGQGIKSSASSEENRLMRGIATSIQWHNWETTAFWSRMTRDANLSDDWETAGTGLMISSLQEGGYHRTPGEIMNRDAITMTTMGINLKHAGHWYKAGITVTRTELSAGLEKSNQPYKQFRFSGKAINNAGINWLIKPLNKVVLIGEFSLMSFRYWAMLHSLTVFLNRGELSILYRNFSLRYDNLLNNPYRTASGGCEQGVYAGVLLNVIAKWTLNAYIDLAWYPWLKFGTDAPSQSRKYKISIVHEINRNADLSLSANYGYSEKNRSTTQEYLHTLHSQESWKINLGFAYAASSSFSVRTKLGSNMVSIPEGQARVTSTGVSISQDLLYRPPDKSLAITFRWMLFDTDDYNSRIYQYEHDVLYAFSIPASYGSGLRCYLLIKTGITRGTELWFKTSLTRNLRKPGGGGSNQTNRETSMEARIQLRIRL
ncbi:MAG: helix-hairpin-helix domain-containing protein [Bacteroidetes bacterium]|nr:helix-hairpin-helix domain-containing protein [Bacteroidota bacterium]